jgi:hypothetical protein
VAASACLLQRDAEGENLIDARYFYFDDKSRGDATSLIARIALADSLRRFSDNSHFLSPSWYEQLGTTGNNPSILGFIVEHMLLSAICAFGCPLASTGLEDKHSFQNSAPITRYLHDYPELSPPKDDQAPVTQLFVPVSHRCLYIDGILVHWNVKAKSVTIAPMQITIATSHSASDVSFMEEHWRHMVAHLNEWEINARFLWIKETRNGPVKVTTLPAKESRKTRGAGAEQLHPPYDVITLKISEVDSSIGKKLSAARAFSATAAKF